MVEITSNTELKIHLQIFKTLLRMQKGNISGKDIIFLSDHFMKYHLRTDNKFYKEALLGISKFNTLKGIKNITKWDEEHIFYNKILVAKTSEKPLPLSTYCERHNIFILQQLLEENSKKLRQQPYDKALTKIFENITFGRINS